MPTLFGHGVSWDSWTTIRSVFEGDFLERVMPGAAERTIREDRDAIQVLFEHGFDPTVGSKPLGRLEVLAEDATGVYYESPLFDSHYVRELVPGLQAGVFGASFRFRVIRDDWNQTPGRSAHNIDGLPERTINELQLVELGPVTFPAYRQSTASVGATAPGPTRRKPVSSQQDRAGLDSERADWLRWAVAQKSRRPEPRRRRQSSWPAGWRSRPRSSPAMPLAVRSASTELPERSNGALEERLLVAAIKQDVRAFEELAERYPGGLRAAQELVRSQAPIRVPAAPQLKYEHSDSR